MVPFRWCRPVKNGYSVSENALLVAGYSFAGEGLSGGVFVLGVLGLGAAFVDESLPLDEVLFVSEAEFVWSFVLEYCSELCTCTLSVLKMSFTCAPSACSTRMQIA